MGAANIFQGIVPSPYIERYTRHYARITLGRFNKDNALIPDFVVYDYPTTTSSQPIRDWHNLLIQALIEIKGLRLTHGNYKLKGQAVDSRAAKVHNEYITKAKWCDRKFAKQTLDIHEEWQGHFQLALNTFLNGTPIGIVIGSNSEASGDLDTLIDTVAKTYSNTPEGLSISPDLSSRGPRGTNRILKAQFTRLIGCTAAIANADLKLHTPKTTNKKKSEHLVSGF